MKKLLPFVLIPLLPFFAIGLMLYISGGQFAQLNPQGLIALEEKNIIFLVVTIMLFLAIPTIIAAFSIAEHYSTHNTKATYKPNWTGRKRYKVLWWAIPSTLVVIISIIVWIGAHQLDPYRPIASHQKTLEIEVIALDWKWLFLYPSEHIATVNYVEFPVNVPVHFHMTADAPMNSFWIPSLGGQMYAMSAMETQLHLLASHVGDYAGGASEINGDGFSGMRFTAKARSMSVFASWIYHVQRTAKVLDLTTYTQLTAPSEYVAPMEYSVLDKNLYDTILEKYKEPSNVHPKQ